MIMASPCLCSTLSLSSSISLSHHRGSSFCLPTWIPQLGLSPFSSWNGLKQLGVSITPKSISLGKRRKFNKLVIYASLFGVGAPEALVIGVVALLVFGPKGLAEVARNLGKTLRAFQPTIREIQDVSREFKSTLEREIGLDDMQNTYNPYRNNYSTPPVANPNDSTDVADPTDGSPSSNRAYTSEEYLKITEDQLKASATQQQAQSQSQPPPPQEESQPENQTQSQAAVTETTSASSPAPQKPENQA